MTDSDAWLIEQIRAGDSAAAGALLRRYFRACFLVALSTVGNRADAEDVCQDAFLHALAHLDECRSPERFGAWLVRITRNVGHNRRRYLRRREGVSLADVVSLPSAERTNAVAEQHELRDHLVRALAALAERPREVVLLHDLEGLRHGEIAVLLGCSEEMSRRSLSDARRRLRALLGAYATLSPDHD